MTITEFARRVGISRKSAYKLVAAGGIEYLDHPYGPIQITEEALAAYLERIKVPARPVGRRPRPAGLPPPPPYSHDEILRRSYAEAIDDIQRKRTRRRDR